MHLFLCFHISSILGHFYGYCFLSVAHTLFCPIHTTTGLCVPCYHIHLASFLSTWSLNAWCSIPSIVWSHPTYLNLTVSLGEVWLLLIWLLAHLFSSLIRVMTLSSPPHMHVSVRVGSQTRTTGILIRKVFNKEIKGHLAGSRRAHNSWSHGCKLEPHVVCRDYFKKKLT